MDRSTHAPIIDRPESPAFSGRAVVELLTRPALMEQRSGSVQVVAELARELSFLDPKPPPPSSSSPSSSSPSSAASNPPASIRSLRFLLPNFVFPQIEAESRAELPAWVKDNVPDLLLPWSLFSGNPPPPPPQTGSPSPDAGDS